MVLACLMFGYLAPVFWMFIEGVYLHSRLATSIFDATAPFKLYYCIGWGKTKGGLQRDVVYLGLTNSALVYEPKCGGKGGGSCRVSANEHSRTQES